MKKLLTLLLILPFVFACSDDKDETEPTQNKTSVIIENNDRPDYLDCVLGYKKDSEWIRVASLGNVATGPAFSKEIILDEFIEFEYPLFWMEEQS